MAEGAHSPLLGTLVADVLDPPGRPAGALLTLGLCLLLALALIAFPFVMLGCDGPGRTKAAALFSYNGQTGQTTATGTAVLPGGSLFDEIVAGVVVPQDQTIFNVTANLNGSPVATTGAVSPDRVNRLATELIDRGVFDTGNEYIVVLQTLGAITVANGDQIEISVSARDTATSVPEPAPTLGFGATLGSTLDAGLGPYSTISFDASDDPLAFEGFADPFGPAPETASTWAATNEEIGHVDCCFSIPGTPNPEAWPVLGTDEVFSLGMNWAMPDVCAYWHLHGFFPLLGPIAPHPDPAPNPPPSACGHGWLTYEPIDLGATTTTTATTAFTGVSIDLDVLSSGGVPPYDQATLRADGLDVATDDTPADGFTFTYAAPDPGNVSFDAIVVDGSGTTTTATPAVVNFLTPPPNPQNGDLFDMALIVDCGGPVVYGVDTGGGPGPMLGQAFDGLEESGGINVYTGGVVVVRDTQTPLIDGNTEIVIEVASADSSDLLPAGVECSPGVPADVIGMDLAKQDAGGPGIPGDPLEPAFDPTPYDVLVAEATALSGGVELGTFALNSQGTTRSDLKDRFTLGGAGGVVVSALRFRYVIAATPVAPAIPLAGAAIVEDFGAGLPADWSSGGDWEFGIPTFGPPAPLDGEAAGTVLAGSYVTSTASQLDTPLLDFTGVVNPTLRFDHFYDIEDAFDGGNLKISFDGGQSFTEIPATYPATIDPGSDSGLANQAAYTGTNVDWDVVDVLLDPVFGANPRDSVVIRFDFGADSTDSGDPGWYVDNVRIGDPAEFPVDVSASAVVESFAGGSPAGWISGGDWEFGIPTFGPPAPLDGEAAGTVLAGSYATSTASQLDTPLLDLSGVANPTLRFDHFYDIEDAFDGGNLKISFDGGQSFTEIPATYPATVDPGSDSGLANQAAYTGTNVDWDVVDVLLTPVLGANPRDSVVIRFDFGADSTDSGDPGWYVDNVRIGDPAQFPVDVSVSAVVESFAGGAPMSWSASGDWEFGIPTFGPPAPLDGEAAGTVLAGTYSTATASVLDTPVLDLSGVGSPLLRFEHYFDIEVPFDGANLKLSTDGGQTFSLLDNLLEPAGYPGTVDPGSDGALAGEPAFFAAISDWESVLVDLDAAIGPAPRDRVVVRFVLGADSGDSGDAGWYVDNVRIGDGTPPGVAISLDPGPLIASGATVTTTATVTGGLAPYAVTFTADALPFATANGPGPEFSGVFTPAVVTDTRVYSMAGSVRDDFGATVTSVPLNLTVPGTSTLPTAILIAPLEGTVVDLGQAVTITATVSQGFGGVTRVDFLGNGELLGSAVTVVPPDLWSFEWTASTVTGTASALAAPHAKEGPPSAAQSLGSPVLLSAVAVDTAGQQGASPGVSVIVRLLPVPLLGVGALVGLALLFLGLALGARRRAR